MGAKVEGESYMPGYYATGDLNMEPNGRWSPYYEERTSNGQLCNGFIARPTNGYSEFDKEMLKHQMLEHEAVFRQQPHNPLTIQVYELHRVYKIQRDMMKHHQSKEIYSYPMQAVASHTNSPSQVPPNGAKMMWQMPVPPVCTTYRKAPVGEHNDINQSSMKFLREGSVQSSPNGFLTSDPAPRGRQGTFDLQLPADHYVDDDNTSDSKPIDFLGLASGTKPRNDADLTLVGAEGLGRFSDNSSTSGLRGANNLGNRQVTDLNESNTGIYMGNGSVSRGLPHTMENSWHQPILRPNTTNFSFNKECSKYKHTDEGTSSNFFDASAKIRHEDKPSTNKGKQVSGITFLAPRYSDADPPKYFKAADGRPASYNQFVYQGQNSSVGWFGRGPLEPSASNNFATVDRPHHSSMGTFTAPISIPQIDHPSIVSPMGSCTADPRSSVINNPAMIPRFNGSSAVNSYTSLSTVTQSIGASTPKLKKVHNLDGHYPGFPLDSLSVSHSRHQIAISIDLEQKNSQKVEHSERQSHGKGMNNFNLNETLSDCQEDGLVELDGRCDASFQHGKDGGSVFGMSWLKNKATCANPTALEKPGKLFGHSFRTGTELKNNKDHNEPVLNIRNLSDSASTSLGCGIKKDGPSEDIITRTLLVCNKAQESATRLPLSCQKHVPKDGQAAEGTIKKTSASIMSFIDLNDDLPNEDNSEESVVSHECQVTPLQKNQTKRSFVIDLEVPACEEDAAWTFDQESAPPGKFVAHQESDNASVTTAMAAAENILVLSMNIQTAEEASDDMLQWFADLAVSNINDLAEQVELQAGTNDSSDDALDSFESLTLKLEEAKIDEYWSRPLEPAITTDEQAVSTAHLLTKPRRGQQRKRRQKRDFQKDILPGLSSLSRPEIIEDVQLLEGLVQASGGSWESSLTRRGRYGRRTRGRKPRKTVVTVTVEEEEIEVSPPPAKPAGTGDLEADERGMIGWGRTTRRCRRTRCPSGNNIAAAS
ncbi:hypothetical protein HU200_029547 [Digitaria exilis]|uniref:Uncharacterized protein n=1 Tax=Digitaria exilis TaxID=1010633 RepID=A0A835EUK7_9POAL|nr:hypothetical protein HU200_029547 [Digitaria exilis]